MSPFVLFAVTPDEAIGGLLISVGSSVVLGIGIMMLIYKMVDGDLPPGPGLVAIFMVFASIGMCIRPFHPVVPAVILVSALALMAFFPFAEEKLEQFELRAIDAERLARTYEAIRARPDNFAARFELASQFHRLGFTAQAIQLGSSTMAALSTDVDDVKNRSLKDLFHREERLLRKWQGQGADNHAIKCPNCNTYNRPGELFCTACSRPYVLDIVRGQEIKPRIWGKLVLSWAAIALLIPAAAGIAMNFTGVLQVSTLVVGFSVVGGLIFWLFQPPKHAAETYGSDI